MRMRECDCPSYISECAHYGDLRVWLIGRGRELTKEWKRRGLVPGQGCPGCKSRRNLEAATFAVFGPGWLDNLRCRCRVPLTMISPYLQMQPYYSSEEEARGAFQERCLMMVAEGEDEGVLG